MRRRRGHGGPISEHPKRSRARAGRAPLGPPHGLTDPFPVAILLFAAVAIGLVAEGTTAGAAEIAVVAAGLVLAYVLPPASGRGVAIGVTLAYLVVELRYSRLDGAHAWRQVLYAAAIFGAVQAVTSVRTLAVQGQAGLGDALTQIDRADEGELIDELLAGGRRTTSVEYELERARRHNHQLTLLLVRPDELQDILDRFDERGAAEICLDVAEAIGHSLRTTDIPLREGAWDFLVLLPETDAIAARLVAERVRLAVGGRRHEFGIGDIVDLSVSIGVAGFPGDAAAPGPLIECARVALEHAVGVGGNRTVLYSRPPGAPVGWGLESAAVTPYRGY